MYSMTTPHDIQESLVVAQTRIHALAPIAMRLRGQFSVGTRTQWHQAPQLLLSCERDASSFFTAAIADIAEAHERVYAIELLCFPHGITLPLLADAEAALASALQSVKRAAKAWARIAPKIVAACATEDILTPLWKKLSKDERDILTATASWFEAADPIYHNIAMLLSSVPVSTFTHALQRALAETTTEDTTTALSTWLRKVPAELRDCVQGMTPSASVPTTDSAIWIRDYAITAAGDAEWIEANVTDGVVGSGYVLALRTSFVKKYPECVNAIGKYLLAEKKHGSGWTRLAHDRLYPWSQPITTRTYTYFVMLPCTDPGKFRIRTKSWSLT